MPQELISNKHTQFIYGNGSNCRRWWQTASSALHDSAIKWLSGICLCTGWYIRTRVVTNHGDGEWATRGELWAIMRNNTRRCLTQFPASNGPSNIVMSTSDRDKVSRTHCQYSIGSFRVSCQCANCTCAEQYHLHCFHISYPILIHLVISLCNLLATVQHRRYSQDTLIFTMFCLHVRQFNGMLNKCI